MKSIPMFILPFAVFACIAGPGAQSAHGESVKIDVHAHRYAFEPAEITVKKGESVTLVLTSDDVPHSLLIKALGVNEAITKGHPAEITFTPTAVGDFKGQCGRFCGSGHGSMLFTVHVKD
jgi:cytochrome c oxidase subunit II